MLIGAAGFVGTVMRYLTVLAATSLFQTNGLGTWIVNLLGSLAIGCVYGLGLQKFDEQTMLVLTVGLLGGFTTYSAFSAESVALLREGRWAMAGVYVTGMTVTCLAATYAGFSLFKTA